MESIFQKNCEIGNINAVKIMIYGGIDVNWSDEEGVTALQIAAANGKDEVVEYLLSNDAVIDKPNNLGWTSLMHAARNGHSSTVSTLINQGADVNLTNGMGAGVISLAVASGDYKTVGCVIKALPLEAESITVTPLIVAVLFGYNWLVKILLDLKSPNDKLSKTGITALMMAALKGNNKIVEWLLKYKAVVTQCNILDQSALDIAIVMGHEEVQHKLKTRSQMLEKIRLSEQKFVKERKACILKNVDEEFSQLPITDWQCFPLCSILEYNKQKTQSFNDQCGRQNLSTQHVEGKSSSFAINDTRASPLIQRISPQSDIPSIQTFEQKRKPILCVCGSYAGMELSPTIQNVETVRNKSSILNNNSDGMLSSSLQNSIPSTRTCETLVDCCSAGLSSHILNSKHCCKNKTSVPHTIHNISPTKTVNSKSRNYKDESSNYASPLSTREEKKQKCYVSPNSSSLEHSNSIEEFFPCKSIAFKPKGMATIPQNTPHLCSPKYVEKIPSYILKAHNVSPKIVFPVDHRTTQIDNETNQTHSPKSNYYIDKSISQIYKLNDPSNFPQNKTSIDHSIPQDYESLSQQSSIFVDQSTQQVNRTNSPEVYCCTDQSNIQIFISHSPPRNVHVDQSNIHDYRQISSQCKTHNIQNTPKFYKAFSPRINTHIDQSLKEDFKLFSAPSNTNEKISLEGSYKTSHDPQKVTQLFFSAERIPFQTNTCKIFSPESNSKIDQNTKLLYKESLSKNNGIFIDQNTTCVNRANFSKVYSGNDQSNTQSYIPLYPQNKICIELPSHSNMLNNQNTPKFYRAFSPQSNIHIVESTPQNCESPSYSNTFEDSDETRYDSQKLTQSSFSGEEILLQTDFCKICSTQNNTQMDQNAKDLHNVTNCSSSVHSKVNFNPCIQTTERSYKIAHDTRNVLESHVSNKDQILTSLQPCIKKYDRFSQKDICENVHHLIKFNQTFSSIEEELSHAAKEVCHIYKSFDTTENILCDEVNQTIQFPCSVYEPDNIMLNKTQLPKSPNVVNIVTSSSSPLENNSHHTYVSTIQIPCSPKIVTLKHSVLYPKNCHS